MENNLIQFIQGDNLSDLENVDINPGSIYFFKDGGIVWDHQEDDGSMERTMMNGQTFIIEEGKKHSAEYLKSLAYKADGSQEYYLSIPLSGKTAGQDTPWVMGSSNWVPLVTFKQQQEWTESVPFIALPKEGTYEMQIYLKQGVLFDPDANKEENKIVPIENIVYSGTFSLYIDDNTNRGFDEIWMSRGGGQGMKPGHYIYARLYGNNSLPYTIAPYQIQLASNYAVDIVNVEITIKKIA